MQNSADLVTPSRPRVLPFPAGSRAAPPLRGQAAGGPREHAIEVQVCGVMQAADHVDAWRDLCGRALDRNVFYDPDFALAVTRHLRDVPRPVFALVRDRSVTGEGSLLGLFPVVMPRLGMGQLELFGWRHDQLTLGTPLVDRDRAFEVVAAFLDWIAGQNGAGGILLPLVAEDSATAGVVRAVAAATGRAIQRFGDHQRAVLGDGTTFDATLLRAMPGKKVKELRRLRRRLEERGTVAMLHASDPRDVRDATEAFLALEASGWKGRSGTAFIQSPGSATFLRSATRSLAQRGQCRVDLLTVGGEPAAAGIVLGDEAMSLYWKTAFDERLASFSPGVQLTLEISAHQVAGGVAVTDSCAVADHPMIDRLWPDRTPIADWFIEARPAAAKAAIARAGVSARHGLRSTAKSLYHIARGRKP
ncbi:MAG: GNAT family N-acetyltransferase [Burkholderiales bacterium]|nr:GNAT family N-acetyltransferase [Burkholderiales bacterium]